MPTPLRYVRCHVIKMGPASASANGCEEMITHGIVSVLSPKRKSVSLPDWVTGPCNNQVII